MKVLMNGIEVECTPAELVELKQLGMLSEVKKEPQKERLLIVPKVKHNENKNHTEYAYYEDERIINSLKNKKNKFRHSPKELDVLMKSLPGRSRKSVIGRMMQLKKNGKISSSTLKRKHFSKHEDRLIKSVWEGRKNKIRLTNKEYKALETLIPRRERNAIGARVFRLRHKGYLKA